MRANGGGRPAQARAPAAPRRAASPAGVAIVGCGYVADLYRVSLQNWTDRLRLTGVHDRAPDRAARLAALCGATVHPTLEAVLADPRVDIVLNLTNPSEHYAVSRRCLEAGRHVYSEKPLATRLEEAEALAALARARGLHLAAAPASLLGEAAQTLWRAVREARLGPPRLVYAELDDGMIHRMGYENWRRPSGAAWPARDEFATGCTLEHAGYALSWLAAMFGPARRVTSHAALVTPDKGPDTPPDYATPDFSCACLTFDGGVTARLTNSVIAEHDHRLRVFCDGGVLEVAELWDFHAPVRATPRPRGRGGRWLARRLGWTGARVLTPARRRRFRSAPGSYPLDFAIGPAEMAEALAEGRAPRLGGDFALHITELSLAIQHPDLHGCDYRVRSSFEPVAPMPWAAD